MKKKLTNNIGMKILSLVIAALLWLIIINIDDPIETTTKRDIVVEIVNEESIKSLDKVYEVIEGSTVDVTLRGKKSVLDTVKISDIRAVADLSNLSYTNAVPIIATCSKPVDITLGKVNTLKVSLEDLVTKQFKITIAQKGTEEEGFYIGSIKAKPNIIQVSGAKSIIEKIDQVRVEMDVSNASEDFSAQGEPRAYDSNGKYIASEKLTFSSNNISLSASILKTKTIHLSLETEGEPLEGYGLAGIEYEPKTITIAGDSSALQKVSTIPIVVDINNAYINVEEEIDLNDYLPEGIRLAGDSDTIMVNAKIETLREKSIPFKSNNIEIKNLPAGATFNYNEGDELYIIVSGLGDNLKNIDIASLNPTIDLTGLEIGSHELEVELSIPEGVTIVEKPVLSITLTGVNTPLNSGELEDAENSITTDDNVDEEEVNP